MRRGNLFLAASLGLLLAMPALATVIDDFSVDDLGNYTSTVILQNGVNTAAWQMGGGELGYNTTSYSNVNQVALIRNGLALGVGEEVQAAITRDSGTQDLGLYVGGVQPTAGVRSTYVSVYARGPSELYSRGFNGSSELGLEGATPASWDSLFITRTAINDYELGYYDGASRNVIVTRSGMTSNDGTYVGFYADIRSAGVLGTATELSVVPEPSALALGAVAAGAGLFCVRRRRARGFSGSGA